MVGVGVCGDSEIDGIHAVAPAQHVGDRARSRIHQGGLALWGADEYGLSLAHVEEDDLYLAGLLGRGRRAGPQQGQSGNREQ